MWNRNIPRNHFWIDNFPNLEASAEGQVMALSWGTIKNFSPVLRDTVNLEYQYNDGPVQGIDKVTAEGVELVEGVDYEDQEDGTILFGGTPLLFCETDYFLVIESDYPINGDAYFQIGTTDPWGVETRDSSPDTGIVYLKWWYADDADVWTRSMPWPGGGSHSMNFYIRGATEVGGSSNFWLTFPSAERSDYQASLKPTSYSKAVLRDVVAHTKIAQKFHTGHAGKGPWYINKVKVDFQRYTDHSVYLPEDRHTKVYFMSVKESDGSPDEIIGIKSNTMPLGKTAGGTAVFAQKGAPSDLRIDFRGRAASGILIDTVSEFIKDAYVNILKGKLADLGDLTELETLPQKLAISLEEETPFGSVIDKLEAGQSFKMVPNLDGSFKFKVFSGGEPPGIVELFDEDIQEFKSSRKITGCVFGRVRVGYDKDLGLGEFKFAKSESDIASLVYKNEETLLFETFLSCSSDAQVLAITRGTCVEAPSRIITFKISGAKGYELTPGDKIKIHRTHADYSGGTMNGVLFRVVSISPTLSNDTLSIVAQLDTQTYGQLTSVIRVREHLYLMSGTIGSITIENWEHTLSVVDVVAMADTPLGEVL